MESAFGIDHGDFAKAATPSMQWRGGEGYYHPSPKQIIQSRYRRSQQKKASVNLRQEKSVQRAAEHTVQAAKESALHAKLQSQGRFKPKFNWTKTYRGASGKMIETVAPIAAAGAVSGAVLHQRHKNEVAKADRRTKENAVLGATAAGGTATAAYHFGGHAVKTELKRQRYNHPLNTEQEAKVKAWKNEPRNLVNGLPVGHPDRMGHPANWKAFARYPKGVTGWRAQRALALKNHPALEVGVPAAAAALGAAHELRRGKRNG